MKKVLILAAAALCALGLSSCQNQETTTYHKGYFYEVSLNVNYGTTDDINLVASELKAVVGDNGSSVRATMSSPADAQMKAGCEAVQKKYKDSGELESVYFTFVLSKITLDPDPNGTPRVVEQLAEYAFGAALKDNYAFYSYSSDVEDAKATLRSQKDQLGENYAAYMQTLYGIETAFYNKFKSFMYVPFPVSEENDGLAKKAGDDLYAEHSVKQNAVAFTYIVYRKDFVSGQTTELKHWTYAPSNAE